MLVTFLLLVAQAKAVTLCQILGSSSTRIKSACEAPGANQMLCVVHGSFKGRAQDFTVE